MYPSHTRKILATSIAIACSSVFSSAATASVVSGSDSFTGSEALMSPRFYRDGTIGTDCSTFSSGNFQYRTYPVQVPSSGKVVASFDPAACDVNVFVTFHTGVFDPANICASQIWHFGNSSPFANQVFNATPGSTITMVVNGVSNAPGVVCGPYSWHMGSQNIALRKLKAVNSATAGGDSWQASYTYNSDRRDGSVFNPTTEDFFASFGGKVVKVPAGSFNMLPSGVYTYKSPIGYTPVFAAKITPSKQAIDIKVSKVDDFGFDLPLHDVVNEVIMGDDVFQFTTRLSDKGAYVPFNSYQDDNFAVTSNLIKGVDTPDNVSIKAKMFLESPKVLSDFMFVDCKDNCNKPSVILRLKDNGNTVVEKDMTGLVAATKVIDKKTSSPVYTLKKVGKDTAVSNVLSSFSYTSKTGALSLAMAKVIPSAPMTTYQSPLVVELVIDGDTFTTGVTMFATDANSTGYSSSFTKFSPL